MPDGIGRDSWKYHFSVHGFSQVIPANSIAAASCEDAARSGTGDNP
jgi:hypothetical protein